MTFIKKFLGIESSEATLFHKNSRNLNEHIKENLLTATKIAEHFGTSAQKINHTFLKLGWTIKQDRWTIPTDKGLKNGAREAYHPTSKVKYVLWEENILKNQTFIAILNPTSKVEKTIEEQPPKFSKEWTDLKKKLQKNEAEGSVHKSTYQEKQIKGAEYEEFVANVYRARGYHVTEYGKIKGREDQGIDLIAKKEKDLIFIQCKNWKENSKWQIKHKDIKAFQTDARGA